MKILTLILFSLLISSCSVHSFQSRRHQRLNFYSPKTENASTLSTQKEKKTGQEKHLEYEALTFDSDKKIEIVKDNLYADNVVINSDSAIKENQLLEVYRAEFINTEFQKIKKHKKTDEEKAKIFERGSKRFFWLFFALLTVTLVASLLFMEYFILPFIGGAIVLLVPTTLHSIYSSLLVKYTENAELKRRSRINFWLILGIYSLMLIALALVIFLVFV